jgi:hypothetical protein
MRRWSADAVGADAAVIMKTVDVGDWMPLVGVAVGSAATFSATWISQRRSDRREDARLALEERVRTFAQRQIAYTDFIAVWRARWKPVLPFPGEKSEPDPDHDWLEPVYEALTPIEVVGTRKAVHQAEIAYDTLDKLTFGTGYTDILLTKKDALKSLTEFIDVVRADLRVPD